MEKIFFQAIGETRRPEPIEKERILQIFAVVHKVIRKLDTRKNNSTVPLATFLSIGITVTHR